MPCYNERDDYLVETCRIDEGLAGDILRTFQKGFQYHGIDQCRMIFEATVDWQGYVPGEVKILSW